MISWWFAMMQYFILWLKEYFLLHINNDDKYFTAQKNNGFITVSADKEDVSVWTDNRLEHIYKSDKGIQVNNLGIKFLLAATKLSSQLCSKLCRKHEKPLCSCRVQII